MPAVQTNYTETQAAAVAGFTATMLPSAYISRNVEDAAGVAFGKPVQQGTRDKGIAAFTTGKFVGITALDRSAIGTASNPDAFPQYASARVKVKGDIWVQASVAVAAGDPVYLTNAGLFTNVATSNTQIVGARWDTSTSAANQLAVVRLG